MQVDCFPVLPGASLADKMQVGVVRTVFRELPNKARRICPPSRVRPFTFPPAVILPLALGSICRCVGVRACSWWWSLSILRCESGWWYRFVRRGIGLSIAVWFCSCGPWAYLPYGVLRLYQLWLNLPDALVLVFLFLVLAEQERNGPCP